MDAFAEGQFSTAISTRNYYPNEAGGHIYISDSVVKAIARYVESGSDGPDHYSNDQSGAVIPEHRGVNIGIFARTKEDITPATISIVRSKVTAEGDTAAIFALAVSADGETIGTIEIEGAPIQTPTGGKIIGYRNKEELDDGIFYVVGQTIDTGDAVIDSPYNEAVAKSTVIAPPEEIKPEEKPGETKPEVPSPRHEDDQDRCSCSHGSQDRRQTRSNRRRLERSIVAAALAGTAAIAAGAVVSRKRS